MPPRTRAITSVPRNSESTPSIVPEARAGTGSGPSATATLHTRGTSEPCQGQMGHSKAPCWILGCTKRFLAGLWGALQATAGAEMGTGRQSVPPAPGSPAGHRSWPGRQQAGPQGPCQGWQGHGDRARAGTSLGTEQRKGSGERPWTGQGWHCRKCPAELVWQTVFNQHWHHQASCLAGEFSESGHCWIFKYLRKGAQGTT